MIREFTETVGRFSKGERRDYPLATWERIAREANKPLQRIATEVTVGKISVQPSVRRATQ